MTPSTRSRDFSAVPSRRSYPSFQHISLSPLSARFPIDGDGDDDTSGNTDYFSTTGSPSHQMSTISYLATSSVPTTPGLLSTSRNVSHTNLVKRKKLSIDSGQASGGGDTHLDHLGIHESPHHQHQHHRDHNHGQRHHRRARTEGLAPRPKSTGHHDNEWLLRTGLALSSSAREEKGQSWLAKRESSTSLVSELHQDENHVRHARRRREHRSGISTPSLGPSTRPSRSLPGSRHTSRVDLRMTTHTHTDAWNESSLPQTQGDLLPDFVNEEIRNRMASFSGGAHSHDQRGASSSRSRGTSRRSSGFLASAPVSHLHTDYSASVADGNDDDDYCDGSDGDGDSFDDVDEAEMLRLTRERGFGLGSWVDRLVEWTLFSVEEEYSPQNPPSALSRAASFSVGPPQTTNIPGEEDEDSDSGDEGHESSSSDAEENSALGSRTLVEQPSDSGGWADAKWLLRIARDAVF